MFIQPFTLKQKTKAELDSLTAKRLLSYYKSIRRQVGSYVQGMYCDCCGEIIWPRGTTDEEKQFLYDNIDIANNYKAFVKSILDTKQHVERK